MKMFMRSQPVALVFAAAVVAGCGGGSEAVFVPETQEQGTETPPSNQPSTDLQSYETLDSTADAVSDLGGVAIRSKNDGTLDGTLDVTEVQGNLQHDTGAATAADGTFTLEDPDGPIDGLNETLIFKDGTATIRTGNTGKFEEDYEYVVAYSQNYNSGGAEFDSMGFIGVVTRATDMPDAGTATYEGEAVALITTAAGDGIADLKDGTSMVEADFGAATVNVTMEGFTSYEPGTSIETGSPKIDKITITGMDIVRNAFKGGNIEVTLNDEPEDVTGSLIAEEASGAFFGYDHEKSGPDETAGVVLRRGDTGVIRAEFIAD